MYPKHFMEQFWRGELNNKLFVVMPFHKSFEARFHEIIEPAAIEAGFECAYRVKERRDSNAVLTKILDGIANSRMVLCDLSNDPKSKKRNHVNGNVLYETGIANTIREPHSVMLIRDQNPKTADFDIRGLTILQPPGGKLKKSWLVKRFKEALENIKWEETKRIEVIAHSLDEFCLLLIDTYGRNPDGHNHFNLAGSPIELRLAAQRLIDLGILWFATAREVRPLEHAYRWTSLAKDLMEYLGLRQLTLEEFKQDKPRWGRWEKGHKRYLESIGE